jgi:hypothetical protein
MALHRERFQVEAGATRVPMTLIEGDLDRQRAEARARELTAEHAGAGETYVAIPWGESWAVARVRRPDAAAGVDEPRPGTQARPQPETPDDPRPSHNPYWGA